MNDHSNDPASIEDDLAETRARLSQHLDELTRRLSPGQLLDEGLSYVRTGQGAAFARNLGCQLRDNPLPVALTGIGLAWLAVASSVSSNGSASSAVVRYDQSQAWRDASEDVAERARRAGDAITRAAEETEEAFHSRVAQARARILGLQQDAAETASAFAERVQHSLDAAQRAMSDSLDRMRGSADAVGDAAQRSKELAARAGSGIADALVDNPLLLAALGVTAGALLGALLPRTSQEEALIAPAAGWAANAARDAADEVVERGARAADAAAAAAYEAASK